MSTEEHAAVRMLLGGYLLGGLDEADEHRVDAHLRTCFECRDELRYLDFGCGTGGVLATIARELRPRLALGLDGTQSAVDVAVGRPPRTRRSRRGFARSC